MDDIEPTALKLFSNQGQQVQRIIRVIKVVNKDLVIRFNERFEFPIDGAY